MSSNNSGKQTEKKSLGLGNKTARDIASIKLDEKSDSKQRPSAKYSDRKKTPIKKGGYRYSELGMKGLTIVLTDGAKVMSAKKRKKVVRKRKMTRKGRKGRKVTKGNKKRTTKRRKM